MFNVAPKKAYDLSTLRKSLIYANTSHRKVLDEPVIDLMKKLKTNDYWNFNAIDSERFPYI
jgi:hypothetical protein